MSNLPPNEPPPHDPNNPFASPTSHPAKPPLDLEGDATGGVIPYKNVPALMAYYCAIFSLIPCIGLALGIPAFILGIIGLRKRKQNPAVKGSAHAWIGIILGGLMTLLWGGLVVAGILGAILNQ